MKVLILKNKEFVAKKAADIIKREAKNNSKLILALSTGKTMISLYKKLLDLYKNNKIDFSKVKAFNIDEYLNVDEKNSFHCFMNSHLFKNINIKSENTYFPPINFPSDYDKLIKEFA